MQHKLSLGNRVCAVGTPPPIYNDVCWYGVDSVPKQCLLGGTQSFYDVWGCIAHPVLRVFMYN